MSAPHVDDPDAALSGFVRAVGAALRVPAALVAVEAIDHWLVRASVGSLPDRLARWNCPCTIVSETGNFFTSADLAADRRFGSLTVDGSGPPFRGFAGVPIALRGGRIMGCMAVLDVRPRIFDEDERSLLEGLASALAAHIERRLGLPSIVRSKAMLLAHALELSADAVRVLRLDEGHIVDVTYQNRAAIAVPSLSTTELAEALDDEEGAVLRAGPVAGSVVEVRARGFEIFGDRYALTVERDVTQHERLEQAFDEAAVIARVLADRYAQLSMLAAVDGTRSDRKIRLMLDFVLRELRMGTAVFVIVADGEEREWEAHGEAALRVAIPRGFIDATLAVTTSVRLVGLHETAADARFSSESVVSGAVRAATLCVGRARPPHGGTIAPVDAEFLRTCLRIAAGDISPSLNRLRRGRTARHGDARGRSGPS